MSTFSIYDDSTGIFEDDTLIEAISNRKAVEKYLANTGREDVDIKSGTGYGVNFCSTKIVWRDGRKYQAGRKSWWSQKPKAVSEALK
jgi:hypothetical protein